MNDVRSKKPLRIGEIPLAVPQKHRGDLILPIDAPFTTVLAHKLDWTKGPKGFFVQCPSDDTCVRCKPWSARAQEYFLIPVFFPQCDEVGVLILNSELYGYDFGSTLKSSNAIQTQRVIKVQVVDQVGSTPFEVTSTTLEEVEIEIKLKATLELFEARISKIGGLDKLFG
ncbi:MAG: hypothetical protein EOP04_03135 [Proteobacteria bacterium]|nr:MAG: hypothetical protein EOP04_03135 [Pseudomonadota bacterium]